MLQPCNWQFLLRIVTVCPRYNAPRYNADSGITRSTVAPENWPARGRFFFFFFFLFFFLVRYTPNSQSLG